MITVADVPTIVSVMALVVSLFTAWFTIFRRGTVRSTHPSLVAFRYDFVGQKVPQAKIFLRMLLFSTGKRGQVVENLFLRVCEGARQSEFSVWGYDENKGLVPGSGLFVPETGVAANHHFNPTDADCVFLFSEGSYSLELVAKLVGRKQFVPLWSGVMQVPSGALDSPPVREVVIFFRWSPDQGRYIVNRESRSEGRADVLFENL